MEEEIIYHPILDLKKNQLLGMHLQDFGLDLCQIIQLAIIDFDETGYVIYPDHLESMKGKVVDLSVTNEDMQRTILRLKTIREFLQAIPIIDKTATVFSKEIDRLIADYAKEHHMEKSHQYFVLKELMKIAEAQSNMSLYYQYLSLYKSDNGGAPSIVAPYAEEQGLITYSGIRLYNAGILSLPPNELTLFQKLAGHFLYESYKSKKEATIEIATFSKKGRNDNECYMYTEKDFKEKIYFLNQINIDNNSIKKER